MQTLIINAQPDLSSADHFSTKLQELFLAKFTAQFPDDKPTILNLYDTQIPRIEAGQLLDVWNQADLATDTAALAQVSAELLAQFKAHHRIVIVSPLHNFNVTSRMKDYLDNILIARETFKYTAVGSVGLMTDDYKVLLLQASGSIYTNNDRYTSLDISRFYLQKMFEEIMGFDQFYIARAQGTATLAANQVLAAAAAELDQAFAQFYV
ncbi:FMN-dependent NADH-azoreductase [Loigolactobacillus jiayinensis]|uniref:FMN dependent NADH:quinone oxidoreductase n=1 Tax=Loigolactobacillus jiayinensis TaxID=2486016 RepID=A0ABW1RDK2_9LACO|nr:NAD(P)H-dependent oxidoreductase [Loigolactobacillus jiayinensis]